MISISAETKLKPGLVNKLKSTIFTDKQLDEFLSEDPKKLAYYLSGIELAKRTNGYGATDELYQTISSISEEVLGTNQDKVMTFMEPSILQSKFNEIDLSDNAVNKIINEQLNPNNITYDQVKGIVKGLLEYLRYQDKRGTLVKLFWC